jgi:dynein heavy chain, axonemal
VGGLQKLIEAADAVDAMQEELKEKKVEPNVFVLNKRVNVNTQAIVDVGAAECTKMIEQIRERSAEVEKKRKLANEKNHELQLDGERISVEKKLAENALDEALPALEAAAEALKNLKKDDITNVKSYANPPGPVKDVCQCVLELKPSGKEDPSQGWVCGIPGSFSLGISFFGS